MNMEDSVIVMTTCCFVRFHNDCLTQHLKNNNSCPMCRNKETTTIVNKQAKVVENSICSRAAPLEEKGFFSCLVDSSMKSLQEFLMGNPFVDEIESQGYIIESLPSESNKSFVLFYIIMNLIQKRI